MDPHTHTTIPNIYGVHAVLCTPWAHLPVSAICRIPPSSPAVAPVVGGTCMHRPISTLRYTSDTTAPWASHMYLLEYSLVWQRVVALGPSISIDLHTIHLSC